MSISDRYQPPHPPGEQSAFALDYSAILPPGVGAASGSLSIVQNLNPVAPAPEWTVGAVTTIGRRVYCSPTGGTEGTDYQLRWTVTDTLGNVWPRTCYVLCAQAS
jgi:hypothetical protein